MPILNLSFFVKSYKYMQGCSAKKKGVGTHQKIAILKQLPNQGCGVGSPVIRLRLRLLAISIIRLRLQLRLRI